MSGFFNPEVDTALWPSLKTRLEDMLSLDPYDRKANELCALSGTSRIDYKEVSPGMEQTHKKDFVKVAEKHLAEALKFFADLPWVG